MDEQIRFIGQGLTLQDLINYADERGIPYSEAEIKIQDIDTMRLHSANQDTDEVYEPYIVLY